MNLVHARMHALKDLHLDQEMSKLRFVVRACWCSLVLIGSIVLLGWFLGVERLTDVVASHVSMKVNTALAFIASGLGLAAHNRPTSSARWFTRSMGLAVLSIGALTTAEYLFHINLHIDRLLFQDSVSRIYPGRMAQLTAINFFLAGLALLLLDGSRGARRVARAAAALLTLDAFAAIIAFLYGVEIFYGSTVYTAMAIHTGAAFLLLGPALLLSDAESTLVKTLCATESGGVLLRRSLAGVILLPIVLGWVYLQPAVNFGHLRLGMALFAVTLVSAGVGAVWWIALALTSNERQREETADQRRKADAASRESLRLEQSNQQLQELAATDQLTGLNNRRAFEQQMAKAISFARRHGQTLSVLMMDVDHFKLRNDTWGHADGDEVLRRIGALLLANVREPDVAARYGGEEFTVLLPGSDGSNAQTVAERIRQIMAEEQWTGPLVTLSIGIASYLPTMSGSDEMLRVADTALYEAKRTGRDRVCVAEQTNEISARAANTLIA